MLYGFQEVQGQKAQFLAEQFEGLFVTEKKAGTEIDIARVLETRGHEHYLEQVQTSHQLAHAASRRTACRFGGCLARRTGKRRSSCANRKTISSSPSNLSGNIDQTRFCSKPSIFSSSNVISSSMRSNEICDRPRTHTRITCVRSVFQLCFWILFIRVALLFQWRPVLSPRLAQTRDGPPRVAALFQRRYVLTQTVGRDLTHLVAS